MYCITKQLFWMIIWSWQKKTNHSTAKQAAQIAKDANVSRLILGHYSSRYKDLTSFQSEAGEIFGNVELAYDGYTIEF